MDKNKQESLKKVLNAIASFGDKETLDVFHLASESESVKKAVEHAKNGDYEQFTYKLMPFQQVIEGTAMQVTGDHRAQFILLHHEFIENHLSRIFTMAEGSPCSVDKSGSVLYALFRHFLEGQKIFFNYEQQFTYHLPSKVLKNQEECLKFFDGIYDLYYGNCSKYLAWLMTLQDQAKDQTK